MAENSASQQNPEFKADAANIDKQKMSLERLGLAIGDLLTVETVSPKRKLNTKLIGFLSGHSILVASPTTGGKDVVLEQSTPLTVRGMVRNQAYAFSTRVVYRSWQPYGYYHLAFPSEMVTVEVRKTSRVTVNLPAVIDSEFDIGRDEWPKSAVVQDLSTNGAGLLSRQILGEKDHEIRLKLNLSISDIHRTIELPCVIRNGLVVDKSSGSHYLFGVEFENATSADRLTIASFLYEIDGDH
ncbi:MAG: hypothetical protein CSA50_05615 [Gammaproteobacteria bacterium]|nr:MAG: hypothetical protein CSA50_05615 [Gammaproteobacteria bacterium]